MPSLELRSRTVIYEGVKPSFFHRALSCLLNANMPSCAIAPGNRISIRKTKTLLRSSIAWFLNGQKTWKTFERFREADIVLQKVIGPEYDAKGLIDHCDDGHRNGIMIHRNDPDPTNLNEVQRQLSYLAKTAQKENVKGKTFFTSRIRKKL